MSLLFLCIIEAMSDRKLGKNYRENHSIPQVPTKLKHGYNCKSCADVAILQLHLNDRLHPLFKLT